MARPMHTRSVRAGGTAPAMVRLALAVVLLLLAVVTGSPAAGAGAGEGGPSLSLAEVEGHLVRADEVLLAAADLELGRARLAGQQSGRGARLFAGAGLGSGTDTSLAGADRTYTTYDLRAGVRFPLLGRAAAEERGVAEAESAVREHTHRLDQARGASLGLLRRQYVALYAAGQQLQLTRAFLADEKEQTALLERRQQAGYLRASARLEALAAFDLARRNEANLEAAAQAARNLLERLTGLVDPWQPMAPQLAEPCLDRDTLVARAGQDHPAIRILEERLRGFERQAALADRFGAGANLDLYSATGNDDSRDAAEYAVGVALGVELPLGRVFAGENSARSIALAEVSRCRLDLARARAEARTRATEALALFHAAAADLRYAERRLQAATETVREDTLRLALPGDQSAVLQQSRYARYQAELGLVEAQQHHWNQQITLLEVLPVAAPAPPVNEVAAAADEPGTAARAAAGGDPAGRGVHSLYVWQAAALRRAADSDPRFWTNLRAAGITRLFLSLDPREIAELAAPTARQALADWLVARRDQGLRVELLLGEPLWMLPAERPRLLAIIRTLTGLPFAGLHLDIEPHQLSAAQLAEIDAAAEWLATVRAAGQTSPWPLGVSVHPLYFAADEGWPGLGAGLVEAEVAEVTLMLYSTTADRVRAVVLPILTAWPGLRFSLAQSVEPELPATESHFTAGRAEFARRMAALAPTLDQANFTGIVVQDWTRWQEMQP